MAEVTVIAGGGAESAKEIGDGEKDRVLPTEGNKKHQKAGKMEKRKRNDSPKVIATQHTKRNADDHTTGADCQ